MYENGKKMSPIETIPGIGGRRIKENYGGVNSTMIYCKNFGKCHNVPQYNNNFLKAFLKNQCFYMLITMTLREAWPTFAGKWMELEHISEVSHVQKAKAACSLICGM
jgi:hypothetical protein